MFFSISKIPGGHAVIYPQNEQGSYSIPNGLTLDFLPSPSPIHWRYNQIFLDGLIYQIFLAMGLCLRALCANN